ncbi:hypothetical protein P170DRAFT_226054 [Aspergillus steynii IBT 23096]|uniref:Uncharacterized protein n=1 Tax=Aspergillus steynii IBT 23096 TaxID=1392250 RepID=A0A2I2G1Y7_9EURO|nr:uncharacterized protein P170DRAFT_226054 [Aspergillus steynii IBT 23096]PLB46886.1 hypothetical protein P170DRAFT_226054 [Aspergillus steynii IBT 23096]
MELGIHVGSRRRGRNPREIQSNNPKFRPPDSRVHFPGFIPTANHLEPSSFLSLPQLLAPHHRTCAVTSSFPVSLSYCILILFRFDSFSWMFIYF